MTLKLAKVTFGLLLVCITALWLLAWTPAFDFLPKALQQLMFGLGGILSIALPVVWVFVAIVWGRTGQNDR